MADLFGINMVASIQATGRIGSSEESDKSLYLRSAALLIL